MRLALKFALFLAVGIFGVLAVEFAVRVNREMSLIEADMGSDHGALGGWLARAVERLWATEGEAGVISFLGRSGGNDRLKVRWVRLDAPEGDPRRPLAKPEALEAVIRGETVVLKQSTGADQQAVQTYVPVSVGPLAAIEIRELLTQQREYVRGTIRSELITTMTLVIVSGGIALALGVAVIGRPIRRLVGKTRRIGAGDLSGRIELRQQDEIGELASEIDTMCELLQQANDKAASEAAARLAAVEQLRHADRLNTVGKLASGIAHQLGTPLNVVTGRSELIVEEYSAETPAHKHATAIGEEAARMTTIIRQLLDFARRRRAHTCPQDLLPMLEATLGMLAPLAEKRRVSLVLEQVERLVARADSGLLQQALINLVMNGIQSMPQGGQITMSLRQERLKPPLDHDRDEADYVRIDVSDEGTGVPAEVIDHVLDPFFTTKPIGEGTGLGLSVAYGIVQEHDGWIGVESEVGRGSRFSIFLPLESMA
jgi:signal transduction histidine kinase